NRVADRGGLEPEQPLGRAVDRLDASGGVERNDTSSDALENGLDVTPASLDLHILALEVVAGPLQFAAVRLELRGHHVEGLDKGAELVAGLGLQANIKMPGANGASALSQQLNGPRDALGEIQAQPRCGDQNEQRDGQEDREVARKDGVLADKQPFVAFVRGYGPSRLALDFSVEVFGNNERTDDLAVSVRNGRGGTEQHTTAIEKVLGRLVRSRVDCPQRQPVGGRSQRTQLQRRRLRRGNEHDIHCRTRLSAIQLNQAVAHRCELGFEGPRKRRLVGRGHGSDGHRARELLRVTRDVGLLVLMISLPLISTSTAGMMLMASSAPTSFARYLANGAACRWSHQSFSRLRVRTSPSVNSSAMLSASNG